MRKPSENQQETKQAHNKQEKTQDANRTPTENTQLTSEAIKHIQNIK